MRVLYTDPAWAIGPDGLPDPALASIESQVLPAGTEIRIGPHRDGRYVNAGPELLRLANGADAIVVYRCQVTPDLVTAAAPGCRVFARQGVGLDNLNIALLRSATCTASTYPTTAAMRSARTRSPCCSPSSGASAHRTRWSRPTSGTSTPASPGAPAG